MGDRLIERIRAPRRFQQGSRTCRTTLAVWACFGVLLSGSAPAGAANESDSCDAGGTAIADGFTGSSYLKLRFRQTDANQAWLCFRGRDTSGAYLGGKLAITAPSALLTPPTVDSSYLSCTAAAGNQVPTSHPIDSGEIGDEDVPPHTFYYLDAFADADEAWLCLQVADVERRVLVRAPGAAPPSVELLADSPQVPNPPPPPPPFGFPSATCQNGPGGDHVRALNMGIGPSSRIWLEAWRATSTRAHLCVRLEGGTSFGGMLSVDATGFPGIAPIEPIGNDMAPCPVHVLTDDQEDLEIRVSDAGAIPVAACVRHGNEARSLRIGVQGSPSIPAVTWTPDPGTPLGPLP